MFVNTPKINKPMWDNMLYATKIRDSALQKIEKDFLSSSVPVIRVMEKILEAKDDMGSLSAVELLDLLKDSFMFLGSANIGC